MQKLNAITLRMPFRMGSVNCYLVETGTGFVLIDTGSSNRRAELENELISAGCKPGSLRLIVLTHGDFDHIGNAAHLRREFGASIAMHRDDSGMAERGDMFWNRSSGSAFLRFLVPILFGFSISNRFSPDLTVDEGDDLAEFGLDARILSLPGHSKGSIGILSVGGNRSAGSGQALFCGDLFENHKAPGINSIMDDPVACEASLKKLLDFQIDTVYPGHGTPFLMDSFSRRGGQAR